MCRPRPSTELLADRLAAMVPDGHKGQEGARRGLNISTRALLVCAGGRVRTTRIRPLRSEKGALDLFWGCGYVRRRAL